LARFGTAKGRRWSNTSRRDSSTNSQVA